MTRIVLAGGEVTAAQHWVAGAAIASSRILRCPPNTTMSGLAVRAICSAQRRGA